MPGGGEAIAISHYNNTCTPGTGYIQCEVQRKGIFNYLKLNSFLISSSGHVTEGDHFNNNLVVET